MSEEQRRANDIAGLRELADFLEANPEVHMPSLYFNIYATSPADLAVQRRLLGVTEKLDASEYLYFSKRFTGDVHLDLNINKEKTCKKVKVGTKKLPAEPAKPEREEDVYEWKCQSLLAAAEPLGI